MEKDYKKACREECNAIRRSFAQFARYRPLSHWAEQYGLNNQQFSRWDNGRVVPTLSEFLKWRTAAGLLTGRKCRDFASGAQKVELSTYLLMCDIFGIEKWS